MSLLTAEQKSWRKLLRNIYNEKPVHVDGTIRMARQLRQYLIQNNWKDVPDSQVHSYCTKAHVEYNMQQRHSPRRINIVCASFLGTFIDISFSYA